MADILLVVIATGVLGFLIAAVIFFLNRIRSESTGQNEEPERAPQNVLPGARPRNPVGVRGAARRVYRRPAAPQVEDESDEEDENPVELNLPSDEKIGAKKKKKLEEKAAKKAQREALEQERKEKKIRDEKIEKQKKKEEAKIAAEEAIKAAEELKLKEEREKQEYEEYLKLKETFTVEEEGQQTEEEQDQQSLLQQFVNYIQETKVVVLEDLAAHFRIKTQDAIDRVKTLQEEGRLSGVIDDRGKFIYITKEEYEAVAKFIKQRGRVSIAELAESMNRLINLNSENQNIDASADFAVVS